ncbi:MAG: hypothetical protein WED34_21210 [Planctomycetales bacterium]
MNVSRFVLHAPEEKEKEVHGTFDPRDVVLTVDARVLRDAMLDAGATVAVEIGGRIVHSFDPPPLSEWDRRAWKCGIVSTDPAQSASVVMGTKLLLQRRHYQIITCDLYEGVDPNPIRSNSEIFPRNRSQEEAVRAWTLQTLRDFILPLKAANRPDSKTGR